MRGKRAFLRSVSLVLFFAPVASPAQETPATEDAANHFRARIGATPLDEKLEVTLVGGERVEGPLAEVAEDSFGLWVEPDEATRERLQLTSARMKKTIRYDGVAALRGARELAFSGKELAFQIRPGDSIRIHTSQGDKVRGQVQGFDGDLLRVGASSFRLSHGDVLRIDRKVNDSLANGALIGLGVGAGWVGLVCAGGECDEYAAIGALILGGGGAGLGALFDALHAGSEVVYVSPGEAARKHLSLAPLVTPDKKGMLVSLRF